MEEKRKKKEKKRRREGEKKKRKEKTFSLVAGKMRMLYRAAAVYVSALV